MAPGRSTRVEELEDLDGRNDVASEPLFAGGAQWEDIEPEEGEQMAQGLAASPEADAGHDAEGDTEGAGADGDAEAASEAGDAEAAGEGEGAASAKSGAPADAAAKPAFAAAGVAAKRRKVPSSAYATRHEKVMRNYRFKSGTRVTNTVSTANGKTSPRRGDFGGPNDYKPSKVPRAFRAELLRTVSVDIGTVVGGKRPKYLDGWVLVFHKSYVKRGKRRIKANTGDHTGWIRVRQLAPRAIDALAREQTKVRRELARGKGSGHAAKVKPGVQQFSIQNPGTIADKKDPSFFEFRIQGGSASTPLGNYTLRPGSYGDVIIGVWNPPGSGAGGERFGGSGGIRAFFPLDATFRLAEVPAMTVTDTTGRGTSIWRYVRATLNGEQIFCWLLQSWRTPKGSGSNF